jgi:DNA-binding CsgD family transcriptional regulator
VPLLALGLRAAADIADRARAGRDAAAEAEGARRAAALAADIDRVAEHATAPTTAALVDLARAEAARIQPGGEGAGSWSGLAERLRRLGDGYLGAYAAWRAGEAELRARGTRSGAETTLRQAFEAATSLRAEPLVREIVALARRARITLETAPGGVSAEAGDVPEAEPAPADGAAALRKSGLSDREIEVLRLVAAGRSNGQIAERLFITRKTAGVHVTHILDKLGVANRVEAAMVAARLGLEPDADEV